MKIIFLGVAALLLPGYPAGAHAPGTTFGAQDTYTHQHVPGDNVREDTGGGLTCGFSSTGDSTGVISEDPNKETGVVYCGPFTIANSGRGAVQRVELHACFKVNDPTHWGGTCRSSSTAGNVGVLWDTISYIHAPGDDLYYCTSWSWESDKGGGAGVYDGDETMEGDQCALATHVEW